MRPLVSEDLKNAYANTLFTVNSSDSIDLKHGEASPQSDALLAQFGVKAAAVLTAWNPYSEERSDDENRSAQARLEADLTSQSINFLPAVGRGIEGDWPPEPSVLALGLDFAAAQELAVKYQQNAFLWIERGFPAELIYPDPEAMAEQASIKVIDAREQSTMASSWHEFLCVRWLGDRLELSVRMYEGLAEISDFLENENGEALIPLQIGGKAVVVVDDGVIVGGDLGLNDDEPQNFLPEDVSGITDWLKERRWEASTVLKVINRVEMTGI